MFVLSVGLRISLYLVNPPENAFDDHYTPVFLTVSEQTIPAKDACWECNQPPVFYSSGALIAAAATELGFSDHLTKKILQALPCFYGILHLILLWLILRQFPLSPMVLALAFLTACFLPRHIYISAVHSNDTISYLGIALCIFLLFQLLLKGFTAGRLMTLSVAVTATVFTKHTALMILPPIAIFFWLVWLWKLIPRFATLKNALVVLILPLFLLSASVAIDIRNYGKPLPDGIELMQREFIQRPGGGNINYFSFSPWTVIKTPVLHPENFGSFWTVVFGQMWFDMEPKFISAVDGGVERWNAYYDYLMGYSEEIPPLPAKALFPGSVLIALGLVPLVLLLLGAANSISGWYRNSDPGERIHLVTLAVLFVSNAAGIILFSIKYPFFAHMKAAFFLGSLPVFCVLTAYGLESLRGHNVGWRAIVGVLALLFLSVTIHIYVLVHALSFPSS